MESHQPQTSSSPTTDWPGDKPTPLVRGTPHYLTLFGLLGATGSMALLALVAEPDDRGFGTHEQLGLPPCRLKQWTDIPCPGCGVTTSVTLAVQGRPLDSFQTQPFGLLTAFGLPLLTVWALRQHWRGEDVYRRIESRYGKWVKLVAALMGVAWVYKLIAG